MTADRPAAPLHARSEQGATAPGGSHPAGRDREGALRAFLGGAGTFFAGFRMWATSPRLMALGAVPALIVGAFVLTLLILLGVSLPVIAEWVTPFAEDWDELWRGTVRFAVGLALLVLAILLAVSTFTALTLAVGDPFYERIWLAVERRLGGFDPVELGFWPSLRRGIRSGLKLVSLSLLIAIAVFAVGLIPIAGGVLGFALGALGGGWLVATELLGRPLDGRNLPASAQSALRRKNRPRVLGFGVAVYLVFLLPLAAVAATPSAVAGATLLARRLVDGASGERQGSDGLRSRLP